MDQVESDSKQFLIFQQTDCDESSPVALFSGRFNLISIEINHWSKNIPIPSILIEPFRLNQEIDELIEFQLLNQHYLTEIHSHSYESLIVFGYNSNLDQFYVFDSTAVLLFPKPIEIVQHSDQMTSVVHKSMHSTNRISVQIQEDAFIDLNSDHQIVRIHQLLKISKSFVIERRLSYPMRWFSQKSTFVKRQKDLLLAPKNGSKKMSLETFQNFY
ncbi:hypothetical protein SSS_08708 [Sarcoptes scabiei]|uniref:Uncharacterized protein n=1 Tax=Sarcoptes scabiei TaxID=52283 RepID=A0A834RF90_SARSC|nr:hypothetical protein SSS_08708 [Sarcoptes scabiei]